VDDLSLRDVARRVGRPREAASRRMAEEALVPRAIWESSAVREDPTAMSVSASQCAQGASSHRCWKNPARAAELSLALTVRRNRCCPASLLGREARFISSE